jgi:hypothetical protein
MRNKKKVQSISRVQSKGQQAVTGTAARSLVDPPDSASHSQRAEQQKTETALVYTLSGGRQGVKGGCSWRGNAAAALG